MLGGGLVLSSPKRRASTVLPGLVCGWDPASCVPLTLLLGEMTMRGFLVFFQEAALASQLCLEESRKEHSSLLESVRQLRKTLEELQDQKAELEAQVDLLQCRSQRLQKRIGCV